MAEELNVAPTADTLEQNFRIFLYTLGGALAMKGWIDESMIEPIVGLFVWAGSWAWWKFWNGKRKESVSTIA